ncbi:MULTISPECIES: styrene monooxygenase/indole monooxygenase family protein [unclassified Cytobacillus]|uniref:styrene monooxygenase/indole monooxygenase family protein n=1 Tax=unclassified Cytobacillus TaxID=2675268 RepID=UPI002041EF26|nr:styrene monooxygenase/indole monooxygenase family protein [Cytobacillus sp. AMY 15.2]MCM3092737.1 styrene monooxygenase [Cytobacillus sp. AMY 15.2]
MSRKICIIGSGTAGLQLAYSLKEEFDVTIIHSNSSEKIQNGRIMSTQVHFGPTRTRENRFNMPKWDEKTLINSIHMTIGDQKLFVGKLQEPALSVDQRLYFSQCLDDLENKGVSTRLLRVNKDQAESLANEFDLIIDCTGKSGPIFPFPIEEELSPFQVPQRKCIVGYFTGIKPVVPLGVSVTVLPEIGEMFEIPAITEHGPVTILFIMAIPDRELDVFKEIKHEKEFTNQMRNVTKQYFKDIHERIDQDRFALSDENAFLKVAIKPVIRKPYATMKNKLIVGCGDSVFLNDPITGQGCNLSSYCAEQLYETIIQNKNSKWDNQLGEEYWNRTKPFVKEVTAWTNAMTQALPEHVVRTLLSGAEDQKIADEAAEWFENPRKAYSAFFQPLH